MALKCPICKTEYTLEDGVYTCQEGHIATHTQEVTEDDGKARGRGKITKEDMNIDTFKVLALIFTELYFKHKPIYDIKSDKVLKIFFSFPRDMSMSNFTFSTFLAVLYLSVRIEREKRYETFLATDFLKSFDHVYYHYWFVKLAEKYNIFCVDGKKKHSLVERNVAVKGLEAIVVLLCNEKLARIDSIISGIADCAYDPDTLRERIETYVKQTRSVEIQNSVLEDNTAESGTDKEQINAKTILSSLVRRDARMMGLYLAKICKDLSIEITPDLTQQFNKFCDCYLTDKRMFIPEITFCVFLFIYLINNKIKMSTSVLKKRFCYGSTIHDQFEQEMQFLIHLEKVDGDLAKYTEFKGNFDRKITFKPFPKVKGYLEKLRLIFCLYMNVNKHVLNNYVYYILLFMDACKNEDLLCKFESYEIYQIIKRGHREASKRNQMRIARSMRKVLNVRKVIKYPRKRPKHFQ